MTRLRRQFGFVQVPARYSRSRVAPSGVIRGARVAFGPAANYISFEGNEFRYAIKEHEAHLARPGSAEQALHALNQRSQRPNLFKAYLWGGAGLLAVTSLVSGGLFVFFLIALAAGVYFVHAWDKKRRTGVAVYDIDNAEVIGRLVLCNVAGEALAHSSRLWQVGSSISTNRQKYHAGAGSLVARMPASSSNAVVEGFDLNIDCWAIRSASACLVLLPDALFVRWGNRWIPFGYEHLDVAYETTQFIEDGPVPRDAPVAGTTWRFVNKSGGPDLRFNNNRQLPILRYGELTLSSGSGHQVVIQTSHPAAAQLAAEALRELTRISREPLMPVQPPASVPSYGGPRGSQERPAPAHPQYTPASPVARPPPPPNPYVPPIAPRVRSYPPAGPALSPHIFARRARTEILPQDTSARFVGPSEQVSVAGRTIASPLTYVSTHAGADTDSSTIVTSLAVGDASRAFGLPYWPRYAEADPDQRARYLDWMASGRSDPNVAVGFVFIFFYGLERRVLIDGADEAIALAEVRRLLPIYGESRSFRGYASDFLAFAPIRHAARLAQMSEAEATAIFRPLVTDSQTAMAAILAWCHLHAKPLPAEYAALVARSNELAKRGAVVSRSASELIDLFFIRYREAFGEGILLDAAKRPLTVKYLPASATLLHMKGQPMVSMPDVFGRSSQFKKLVELWNDCVDDLRKANARKGDRTALDAAAWSALPAELRDQYDHPDQDKWDAVVAAMPVLGGFHLAQVGQLGSLTGVGSEKLTAARLKKIAQRATDVGYAIEPDPRLRPKAADNASEILIWRAQPDEVLDTKLYGAIDALLRLAMNVAMADGVFTEEEHEVVNGYLAEVFTLDAGMRVRVEAMKQLISRSPTRLNAVIKALRASRSREDLTKVGTVLVAIAAADGTIAEAEEKALRALYKGLGLPPTDLAAAIVRTGARLERDAVVEVQPAKAGAKGVAIPPAPDAPKGLELDQAAIDAIMADTKDVAAILAEVFETESDEPESTASPSVDVASPIATIELPKASAETARLAQGLDIRYHAALEELLHQPSWSAADVRQLAQRHRLMPGAIVETINGWSDDTLGDFLIEDNGDWKINLELAKVTS
jgi:tellurite resistance protein